MNDLVKISNELNTKTKLLLETFPFQKLAEKHFGNITYTGSFAFNLMIDPDIDSNILLNPLDKSKIMAFANDLTEIQECRKVILYNRLHEEIPYFIINVERFVFENETWTLTFFIQETDFQGAIPRNDEIMNKITPENRKIILELKDWRVKQNLKADIPSVYVYDAVFDNEIKDIESFKKFAILRKPELKLY
jgi:hypothetical protein